LISNEALYSFHLFPLPYAGFTGADLASLVREAGLAVVREWRETQRAAMSTATSLEDSSDKKDELIPIICSKHFDAAFGRVHPSVSPMDRQR
jgi:SpoVK/Ycf46/Vps4 family AAA+-type ATPase